MTDVLPLFTQGLTMADRLYPSNSSQDLASVLVCLSCVLGAGNISHLTFDSAAHKKVKQSHYRPEVPRGFQEVKVPRLRNNEPDGGKVVSLTHRPFLPPGNNPGTY